MSWIASLMVALLTGIVGLVASAFAANLAVNWYDVNAFEGAPGFFVAGFALIGLIVGGVVGLVASRLVARSHRPDWRTLGASIAATLTLVVTITATARLLADIPPEIDRETLFLSVELRTPVGHASPAGMPGVGYLKLRKREMGPLFTEDARYVDGRWVIPGVVRIFTSRGRRTIETGIGSVPLAAFTVPLPAHPGAESRQWSEWLPRPQSGAPLLPDQFTYRYKVVRQSEPLRVESMGRLAIETVVSSFYRSRGSERVGAISHFRISHDGKPLTGFERAESVAVLKAPRPVLLVLARGLCHVIADDGARVDVKAVGRCQAPIAGRLLTSDPVRFAAARGKNLVSGWVDRVTFETPGLFQVDGNILDTRWLTFSRVEFPSDYSLRGPPPLGLSPDERSFVWFAALSGGESPRLGVTDWKAGRSYRLQIDRDRMRFNGFETLDPAWVTHHFTWRRGSDGVDVLEERPDFVPLPYRGEVSLSYLGEPHGYLLLPAGEPLRKEVVRMLVEELHGERLPDARDGSEQRIRLDGKVLGVRVGSPLVIVALDFGERDPELIRKVAAHIDAALASGKYDALFGEPPKTQTP